MINKHWYIERHAIYQCMCNACEAHNKFFIRQKHLGGTNVGWEGHALTPYSEENIKYVLDVPRNLSLNFHKNRVS